ncbi:MAG: hypothetical protein KA313_05435 [Pseudarcicella sp.]|jgi:hypothetical protein|nr:hypothetical protein [Pseudarcicella sp.]MBP6410522.1 hypothetical protein [Pseudarcicella sp.]
MRKITFNNSLQNKVAKYILNIFLTFNLIAITHTLFAQNKQNSASNALIDLTYEVSDENRALITWYVAEKSNPVRYVIQRSRDNVSFFDIKTIEVKPAVGGDRVGYSFIDPKALKYQEFFRVIEYNAENVVLQYETFVLKPKSPVSFVSSSTGNGLVRLIISDTKNLKALLCTENNLGVPCDFLVEKENESVVLKPKYMMSSGNYKILVRSTSNNNEYRFAVKNDDI